LIVQFVVSVDRQMALDLGECKIANAVRRDKPA
jgi:hypothetical protein